MKNCLERPVSEFMDMSEFPFSWTGWSVLFDSCREIKHTFSVKELGTILPA